LVHHHAIERPRCRKARHVIRRHGHRVGHSGVTHRNFCHAGLVLIKITAEISVGAHKGAIAKAERQYIAARSLRQPEQSARAGLQRYVWLGAGQCFF
jgi:hypothetical protein